MTNDVTNKVMVAGFLFCGVRVLLVQKQHPDWQHGLWNGVGGVVEPGEEPGAAMVREFSEETGWVSSLDWRCFCTELEPMGATVHFFAARVHGSLPIVPDHNDAGEPLAWCDVGWMLAGGFPVLGNLKWLVPMALDWRETICVTVAKGDIRRKASW